jgi:hypothetical protein
MLSCCRGPVGVLFGHEASGKRGYGIDVDSAKSADSDGFEFAGADEFVRFGFADAELAVGASTRLDHPPTFTVAEVTTTSGDDFLPSQPSVSRIVKVSRASS